MSNVVRLKSVATTYRSGYDESREEIPDAVEEGRNDGSDVVIWSNGHGHHTVEDKVE